MNKPFKINDYITLSLEDESTIIYVAGKPFRQCKYLLMSVPATETGNIDEIGSIDEAAETLNGALEDRAASVVVLPPEVEFWGHCSNLQAWAEHDYDTRLLHTNLAFPLLKKLVDEGDASAQKVFKEEIAKRLSSNYHPVVEYLIKERYLKYLNDEEVEAVGVKIEKLDLSYKKSIDLIKIINSKALQSLKILVLNGNRLTTLPGATRSCAIECGT